MEKTWISKRSVRIGVLLVIGFAIGAGTSYMAAYRKAQYYYQQRQDEIKAGHRLMTLPDGTVKVVPVGKPSAGTEDPTKAGAPEETLTSPPKASPGDASLGELIPAISQVELDRDDPVKQARLKAHTQPAIGVYLPGGFRLMDGEGRDITEKSWPGKYLLIYFGYTHCPDVCPVTMDKMAKVMDNLGPLASRVQPLFITVDPARDTQDVVKAYAAKFSPAITGLTGTLGQVKAALQSYKVEAEKADPKQTGGIYYMNHSAYIYLMSPANKLEELFRIEQNVQTVTERLKVYLITANPGQ